MSAAAQIRPPSVARFVATACLIAAVLVGVAAWLRTEYQRSEAIRLDAVRSSDRQVDQLTLLSRLTEAETAQRGFLLTGDPAFLRTYEPTRESIRGQIAAAMRARNPDVPRDYLPTIDRLVARKFDELDRTIALYRAGDGRAADRLVGSGTGMRLMNALRGEIGRMIAEENRQSDTRQAAFVAYRSWLQRTVYAVVGGMMVGMLVFLLVWWRLRRERHASLIASLEAAERHAAILDGTIDAILILGPGGTVETVNAAATRMLGYSPAELERRDIAAILDLAPGHGSFHQRVGLVDGQLRRSVLPDLTVRHSDGHAVAVDVAIGVMRLPSGDHLVLSLRDIAERKRVERVKDELISTVSHELRTPLTSIVGSLGLLRAGAGGAIPSGAGRLVEIAENNSRRLIRLINDMLDIDRIESGGLAMDQVATDVRAVIDEACVGSEGLARTGEVELHCAAPPDAVIVSGDAARLVQVVTNLLSNAIRAAPAGSAVEIGLDVEQDRAIVAVEDRGGGVPPAFRDRLFGRFERATGGDGATGTGLGLAISREIVQRHGGTIWYEDRRGGGARFAFSLPLVHRPADYDDGAPVVLVCEADDAQARALFALVAAEGCACDRARTTAEARVAIAGRRYLAVLVSMTLPEEGGLSFAQAIRHGDPPVEAPIIVIADGAERDGDSPATLDIVDWIGKPSEPERLSLALRTALARSTARRPVILHLDDDRDLLDVVAAAVEPEARLIPATDLQSALAILQVTSPDVAILDMRLAQGSGLDLIPFLVDAEGLAIPTIMYSAQDVPADQARGVDAVLVKARGSMPDLKATIRHIVRTRGAPS